MILVPRSVAVLAMILAVGACAPSSPDGAETESSASPAAAPSTGPAETPDALTPSLDPAAQPIVDALERSRVKLDTGFENLGPFEAGNGSAGTSIVVATSDGTVFVVTQVSDASTNEAQLYALATMQPGTDPADVTNEAIESVLSSPTPGKVTFGNPVTDFYTESTDADVVGYVRSYLERLFRSVESA